jgi:hypothetical protein
MPCTYTTIPFVPILQFEDKGLTILQAVAGMPFVTFFGYPPFWN